MSKANGQPKEWTNRITHYGEESPDQLLAHPLNAFKIHPKTQQDAMEGTLNEVGWLTPILVSEQSGMIIDGHMRVALAISRGVKSVPVAYLNLTPEEEPLALATFDQLGAMIVFDKGELDLLLQQVSTGDAAVTQMLAELAKESGLYADPDSVDFKEYGEDAANDVEYITCPECGHKWPK